MTSIAILGGTGPQGRGLGYRFARAGHVVTVGSRSADRAEAVAAELSGGLPDSASITGADNAAATAGADVVVIAVPFAGFRELLTELAGEMTGRIVVSCVNPLGFDKRGSFGLDVPEGSAAELAAALLPGARVVSAFHHLSAVNLVTTEAPSGEDVLVCGDDAEARATVCNLAAAIVGKPGIAVGPLRLSRYLENLTAVLISINRRYKAHSGVAITGLPRAGE